MKAIEQIYTNCLAQGAYFVESEGEAFVIDPLRETLPYIERAEERGVKIKYIFETHFHADFVSGHLDLAKKTGATIVYGPKAETSFEKYTAKDGEEFKIGKLTIRVLHTPGHTPESTTYLLLDENGKEHAIFTGDTLFIGDVGRPDLAQKATGLTQEDLAGWLYDSLRNKILTLPDDIIVYPAHGAGSSCGKNMSSETWDTLGNQKKTNYALRADMTKDEFIKEVTHGLMTPPQYFAKNAAMNKKGYGAFDDVMARGLQAHSVVGFKDLIAQDDVIILDVRDKEDFVKGYIPGSIFIGLDGNFAPWVGAIITDIKQKIALVTPIGKEEEAVTRLARVGYDYSVGYLEGSFDAWKNAGEPIDSIDSISVKEFVKGDIDKIVVDVRKPSEFDTTHMVGSINVPLDYFPNKNTDELDPEKSYFVHCRSGFRSTIASSLLRKRGIKHITNVLGSFDVIKENSQVEGTCPSLVL
jgi:glyoxylase-like metal-dependent hydrolase (beta-lactamase superfamily II)/rhodanese-related sulfurtransferase